MSELPDGLKDRLVEDIAELPSLNEIKARCILVQTAVDEAIALARETDGSWQAEPINWADLYCVEVDFVVNWSGFGFNAFYRATVEEAAPSCMSVRNFINLYLIDKGFGDVEVVTEW